MSEVEHTPGNWHYEPDSRLVYADRDGDTESPTICDVLDTTEGLEGGCPAADANGRLLAAAPDLLAACEAAIAFLDEKKHGGAVYWNLYWAIAKARGNG